MRKVIPMNSSALWKAALTAVAAFGLGGSTASAQYGTIKGKLVWGGDDAPARKVLEEKGKASKDPAVCAEGGSILSNDLVVDPKTKGVKYGFAYIPRPTGANPDAVKALLAKSAEVEIDQKNCEFVPYALAGHQDQKFVFKSSDAVNHNVHLSPFGNAPFNTILAPNGSIEKKFVAERRPIPLTCDIHPWMKGWVMVFDHPFFAITGEDGSFEITGVPAGAQKLVVWQSSVGYANEGLAQGMAVNVPAGGVADVGTIKVDPKKVK
jgi:hypothetical protein